MGKFKDLAGQKFNRWNVLRFDHIEKESFWYCQCDCGNFGIIRGGALKNGQSKSCGCLQKEKASRSKYKGNQYIFNESMSICLLQNGQFFIFDTEDYDLIKDYTWNTDGDYIVTYLNRKKNKKRLTLSRLIMGLSFGSTDCKIIIDHINHNVFDNRKSNLRIVTRLENAWNVDKRKDNTSGCRGVYFLKDRNKYSASIMVNGITIYLGQFNDINDAIKARKEAEMKYYGEYRFKGKN